MEWEIHFFGNVTYSKRQEALDNIMTANPPVVFGNTLSTKIGDMLIFLENYTASVVQLEFRVLNMTLTPEVLDSDSFVFKWYGQAVCEDVSIYVVLSK